MKLSRGDMRRALNVLQACHAAYDIVDEAAVYTCTGNPQPADIQKVVQSMLSDEFGTAFNCELCRVGTELTTVITSLKAEKGLALQDLITGAYDFLETVKLPANARIYLLDHLGQTEQRLALGGSEKMQLTALLGAFKVAVELSQKK